MRDDGEPVGLEDREERLVRLGDGDLLVLRRVDVHLDVAHLAAVDEPLAGDGADGGDELGQIAVFDGEVDQPFGHLGELGVLLHVGERHRPRGGPFPQPPGGAPGAPAAGGVRGLGRGTEVA